MCIYKYKYIYKYIYINVCIRKCIYIERDWYIDREIDIDISIDYTYKYIDIHRENLYIYILYILIVTLYVKNNLTNPVRWTFCSYSKESFSGEYHQRDINLPVVRGEVSNYGSCYVKKWWTNGKTHKSDFVCWSVKGLYQIFF